MTYRLGKQEFHIPEKFQTDWFRQIWDPKDAIGQKGSYLKNQLRYILMQKEKHSEEDRKYIDDVLVPIYRFVNNNKHMRHKRQHTIFKMAAVPSSADHQQARITLQPFACLCCKATFWEEPGTRLWLSVCFGCQMKMNVPEYMRKGPPNVESVHRVICTSSDHSLPWSCQTHGCVWSVHAQPFFHRVWLEKYQQTLANNPFF